MAESAPKVRREKKEAFKIDFLTPPEKSIKLIAKELFVPATRGTGITLPGPSLSKSRKGKDKKGKEKDKRTEQTLPDDMHFSSKQLVTLFLKPQFSVCWQVVIGLRDFDIFFFRCNSSRCAAGVCELMVKSTRISGRKLQTKPLARVAMMLMKVRFFYSAAA